MRITPVLPMLVLCLAPLCPADDTPVPTAADLLKRVEAEQTEFENRVVFAVWEQLSEDKVTGTTFEQTWRAGDGRVKIAYQAATWDRKTRRVTPVPDARYDACIYDGRVTADMWYDPTVNRHGQKAKESEPLGYRACQVYEGMRRANFALRDPFRYAPLTVTSWIERALDEDQPVKVRRVPGEGRSFMLTYPDPQYGDHSTVTIDADRGWTISKIETFDAAGRTIRVIEVAYEKDPNGHWAPMSGSHKHYGQRTAEQGPLWSWRFVSTYARRNDPAFDYSAFDILLEPDTAVSDLRFRVAFRIGDQPADVEKITELARQAKAARE